MEGGYKILEVLVRETVASEHVDIVEVDLRMIVEDKVELLFDEQDVGQRGAELYNGYLTLLNSMLHKEDR